MQYVNKNKYRKKKEIKPWASTRPKPYVNPDLWDDDDTREDLALYIDWYL